jgi:4-oxalocrotonate tautomerase family enzyme
MPIVETHLLKGYSADTKKRLSTALTNAIRFIVPAPDDAITVMIHEYAAENYARGGQQRSGALALPDPIDIVKTFLSAMEARDIEKAQTFLAPGFAMVFPGTAPMAALTELVEWARGRYRFVTKTYDAAEAFHCTDAKADVVYVRGTLSGEWPDGTPFTNIRFIDRFEVRDGLILRQDVWNDIAEERPE